MKKAVVRHENNKPLWVSQNWAVNFYKDTGIRLELINKDMPGDGPVMFKVASSNNDDLVLARHQRINPDCKHCI